MAKKNQKTKYAAQRSKPSAMPRIFILLIVFAVGLWIGSGGVRYNQGKIALHPPDISGIFNSPTQKTAKTEPSEPAIKRPALGIFEDGYGNCTVSEIVSVYDGDTFRCDIDGLSDIIGKNISVRLRGIDTPEMRDKDPYVKARAIDARDFTKRKLLSAEKVELKNIDRDKYFRLLADVYVDGKNLSEMLLQSGLAREYHGGKKESWK